MTNGLLGRWRAALLPAALLVALGAVSPSPSSPSPSQESEAREPIHLVVLHTNDVHGQALPRRATWIEDRELWVGGLERVAAYVAKVRAEQGDDGVLLLDGGDWFQGTPEGRVRGGRDFVELLARLDYDAMALGNHEFDLGIEPLLALLLETEVPSVCANLYADGERVGWVRPYRLVERCGLEIAVVGLISPVTPDITNKDARRLDFRDPLREFDRAAKELPAGVDLVIPLTHDGLELDRALAAHRPDLPLIVGGHSHTYLRDGVLVGDTRIVQAGDKATVVGRVDLDIDPVTKKVLRSRSRLIELDEDPDPKYRDPELAAGIERLRERTDREMSVVVGSLAVEPGAPSPYTSSALGNWIADAMRAYTRADVGVHNRGGIRSSLAKGPVTRRNLFEVLPFANTVVSFELTGAELLDCMTKAVENRPTVRIEVSGMEIDVELREEGRIGVRAIRVGGAPIDPERRYRVATNSFLADGGDSIFRFDRELDTLDTGSLIREVLELDLANGPFTPPADARIDVRR
ncbi:MAG: bifunctional UDP-sugar hydrolase/5'-nucleotidase [Planctomycetota bacterium]